MKIPILLLKFFFIGALFIISNNALYLSNPTDFVVFKEIYFQWIETLFDNISHITSYVVQAEWLAQ